MRSGILTLLFLIIVGVIVANMFANAQGVKTVLDGLTEFWSTSLANLQSKPAK